ncbi:ribonuclease H-like domain-containing protein [Rhizophagus irregularis DAOM 181602=DAOM 197198]|nr:ribonuclease H-like domain-containing protein [Rhizophagus irregularis DAOM 181602=DAOM 197198]
MGITTDNASNNSTFMTFLSFWAAENVVNFNKKEQHIRCFAHSINLSVKEALSCLDGEISLALEYIVFHDKDLKKYTFSEEKWAIFEQIKNFLEIFKEVTVIMSGSHYPTLSLTVPLYNILIDHVEDVIGNDKEDDDDEDDDEENEENNEENNGENDDDEKWNQIVKKAAKKCKVKLLEYYNKTNDTYLISTILDPRLKLKYYKDHNWEETLVNTIYQKFVNIYNKFYASTKPEVLNNTSEIKGKSVMSRVFKQRNIEYIDEIQTYLSLSLMNKETDPLEWWKVNESQFPHLSQMARDYLPIPATSVPSEQSFSVGKNLITDKRNCLAGKTIRICMCLQSW